MIIEQPCREGKCRFAICVKGSGGDFGGLLRIQNAESTPSGAWSTPRPGQAAQHHHRVSQSAGCFAVCTHGSSMRISVAMARAARRLSKKFNGADGDRLFAAAPCHDILSCKEMTT